MRTFDRVKRCKCGGKRVDVDLTGKKCQPGRPRCGSIEPDKLKFAPDFWRKRAEEARRLAELIEDNFTAETVLEIARQYDHLAEHAERRQHKRD